MPTNSTEPDFADSALIGVVTGALGGRSGLGLLDYRAPPGGCNTGDFVEVPLGPRRVVGVVWGKGSGDVPQDKLRAALRVLDIAPLQSELRQFLARAAEYTMTPLPAMLRLATRAPGLLDGAASRRVYRLTGFLPNQMTESRANVIAAMRGFSPDAAPSLTELTAAAGCSASVIKGLVNKGILAEDDTPRDLPFPHLDPQGLMALEGDQIAAAKALCDAVFAQKYSCTLLKGVTGSGKTEVYLEAVAACLDRGMQALVLIPEIALTADFLARVEARFGARPAEWHSGLTLSQRRRVWRMVAEDGAQMVVGARSALFLPFAKLGLIVVDEEHDSAYKQEEGVLYNARDMAVLRAALRGCAAVLASATPSLESWANAESGKYARFDLSARFGAVQMPIMRAIDMRAHKMPHERWISPPLQDALRKNLEAGAQSLLFINRRGYAPATLCRACGEAISCHQCSAKMVEHRSQKKLMCHQCGAARPVPQLCPSCKAPDSLAAIGPGVERIEQEAQNLFPKARVSVLSSDLFGTANQLKTQISAIAEGGTDIIIGTQIVAKGHNFPKLTLVGVIDADLSLYGSDMRAAERTFALMRQVAGRAGRAVGSQGLALLQTHQPDHPVLRAIISGNEDAFWRAESQERRAAEMPPYGRMAGVILTGIDLGALMDFGTALARRDAPLRNIGAEIFGPAPAPIARIRGRFRVRLLIKAPKKAPLQTAIALWIQQVAPPSNLRLNIDIDPQNFL